MKKLKKIISGLLSVVFLGSTITNVNCWAADTTVTIKEWDGTVDTSWEGKGTKSSPYKIYTAGEFAGMINTANNNAGSYYELMNDIDLGGKPKVASDLEGEWTGINWGEAISSGKVFEANFDGNNHKITGFYMTEPDASGVFGYSIGCSGVVKNVRIYGKSENGRVLCNTLKGTVSNCYSNVNVEGSIAAMITEIEGNSKIEKCYNYGNVIGTDIAAGIVGKVCHDHNNKNIINVKDCANYGEISLHGKDSEYASGIVGYFYYGHNENGVMELGIYNCENYGNINASAGIMASGIINAYTYYFLNNNEVGKMTVNKCINDADITSGEYASGIFSHKSILGKHVYGICKNISECLSKGTLNGKMSAGIVYFDRPSDSTVDLVEKCYSMCEIEGTPDAAYGIGQNAAHCYYTGNIEMLTNVEGQSNAKWDTYKDGAIQDVDLGLGYYEINELSDLQNGFPALTWEKDRFDVTEFSQTATSKDSLSFVWDNVSRATSYDIFRKDESTGKSENIATTTLPMYTDNNVESGKTYEYQIQAVLTEDDATYKGNISKVFKAETIPDLTWNVQENEKILNQKSVETNTTTIGWSSAKGATGYEVYEYNATTKYMQLVDTTEKTEYTFNNLSANTKYIYSVKPYYKNSLGTFYGQYSNNLSVITKSESVKNDVDNSGSVPVDDGGKDNVSNSGSVSKNIKGDVDNSGSVNLNDAKVVLKLSLGISIGKTVNVKNADYNYDGKVDLQDAKLILKKALGIN